jgi:TetR/AcrR family transcriptional repressor of mexJK operon
MEEIASLAGLTKRTVYNNYRDKDALFTQIVADVIAYAEAFAGGLHEELMAWVTAANLRATLVDLGRRMALAIVRPEVVALRRLLIGEARSFPALAKEYFDRAPGQVIEVPWRRDLSTWAGRIAASARRAARGRAVLLLAM